MDEYALEHYNGITVGGLLDTENEVGLAVLVPRVDPIASGGEGAVRRGKVVRERLTADACRTIAGNTLTQEILAKNPGADFEAATAAGKAQMEACSPTTVRNYVTKKLFGDRENKGILGENGDVVVKTTFTQFNQNPRSDRQRYLVGLEDPNIAFTLDYGRTKKTGRAYSIVERLGNSLRSRVGTLSEDEVLNIAFQIVQGLQTFKRLDVVHRDLKPDNILFAKDSSQIVKITDLGLMKGPYGDHKTVRTMLGTPDYMPPEQVCGVVEGTEIDWRADQFALGATLYELISGNSPLPNGQNDATLVVDARKKALIAINRPRLPSFLTEVNKKKEGLELIVGKMMHPERDKRYQSWDGVMADIERVGEGGVPLGTSQNDAWTAIELSTHSAHYHNKRYQLRRLYALTGLAAGAGGAYYAGLFDYLVKLLNQ